MRAGTEIYGSLPDGQNVLEYTLENDNGMQVKLLNYGGIITSVLVPDRQGNLQDVVLGHPSWSEYVQNPGYLGALVGRNCNRIRNGVFEIGGRRYSLERNDGAHNLHSGSDGLSYALFESEIRTFNHLPAVLLSHSVAHLTDGFPGNLNLTVAYALTNDNALMIDYRAVSDQDTVINLTNHSYFNLGGHDSGPIYDHVLQIESDFFTPNGPDCIPTGEILQVQGTPFDFRTGRQLGPEIGGDFGQIQQFGGYDHNLLLNGWGYRKVGTVTHPPSGRGMEIYTDQPGVQLYTGNVLSDYQPGKGGARYGKHHGLCLETQYIPNSMNMPWLLCPLYAAGEEYTSTTTFQFFVMD